MPDPVARLEAALTDIASVPVALERPGDPIHGDYATNVALRIAPSRSRPPREIAEEIAAAAVERGLVLEAEVAGPGFVNLRVSDEWIAEALAGVLDAGESFGGGSAAPAQRIQVEMVSANPTGPLTVASARNGAYGDAVARLLTFAGHTVEREYYYNDAGAQMDRFRESVEAMREGRDPPEDGYQGEYVRELAATPGDPVPAMLERIEQTLARFRVHFDTWERESAFGAEVDDALPLLDTYKAEGALWARTTAYGDDKDRVLVRSNGEPTYFGKDAAYIRRKLSG
ncbi:MAG: arginine--tRNA ligase, partial [Gaiellaceae bacterium]